MSYSNYYEYSILKNLIKKQAVCMIYKTNSFKIKNNIHNLRKKNIEIPFTNTKKVSNTYIQVGLKSLDIVPNEIRNCLNYSYFK